MTTEQPVVLVLEDCHWIDELSRDLLEVLARAAAGLPVLIVLAYRPAEAVGGGLGLERMPGFQERRLDQLGGEEAAALIRSKLEQIAGAEAEASESLVALVTERAGGNPFYIEELVSFIASQGIDPTSERAVRDVELPESLHSLVLGRIDTVGEEPRRTLKVASVVGRTFEAPLLPGAYPELGPIEVVVEHLEHLRGADLVNLDREAEQAWLFKHMVTQEVAYESLPFAVRTMLHGRIGQHLEETAGDAIERRLDLLAYHYSRGDFPAKAATYLELAADAAREAYANAAAIDYLERLLPLLDGRPLVQALLKLGKTLEFVGQWARAEGVGAEALERAVGVDDPTLLGWGETQLAEVARKQGRFDEANERLIRAEALFTQVGADDGLGQVYQQAGTVAAQRGDYDAARERYGRSIAVRERLDDRKNLGSLYSNLGDHRRVRRRLRGRSNPQRARPCRSDGRWRPLGHRGLAEQSRHGRAARTPARRGASPARGGDPPTAGGRRPVDAGHRAEQSRDCSAGSRRHGNRRQGVQGRAGDLPRSRRSLGDGVSSRGHRPAGAERRPGT